MIMSKNEALGTDALSHFRVVEDVDAVGGVIITEPLNP